MPLLPGVQLGRYEILGTLGTGGMGEVYRARDSQLNRTVAVKVLSPGTDTRRFEQEARALAALTHPNIVAVYDVGGDGGMQWPVQELVDGESLRTLLRKGPLELQQFRHLAVQIAAGLAAAHALGIVHRDLKPENIMITRDRCVRILDFGLARHTRVAAAAGETVTAVTSPGMVAGTPAYMSPEQIEGKDVNTGSDIFSFGVGAL
jgi:eukaryotic-like serine/threonine-protein kinase